jgi:hypothetical protein
MRSMVPPAARPLGDGTTILIAYTTKTKQMYGPPPFRKRRVVGDGLCANVSGL